MDERRLHVGELARSAGLTVRTLHHWDELGLLVPSARTEAGYRLYDADDVGRLYRIVALRSLGLSLEQIRSALEDATDLRALVERQLEQVDETIALQQQLRERLERVLRRPTTGALIEAIEVMTMIERHYTPEQLRALAARAEEAGPAAMERAQREWTELYGGIERARAAGTDSADPSVQRLLDRADALIERFTGGDPELRAALGRMYEREGPERASHGLASAEAFAFMERARAARASG